MSSNETLNKIVELDKRASNAISQLKTINLAAFRRYKKERAELVQKVSGEKK